MVLTDFALAAFVFGLSLFGAPILLLAVRRAGGNVLGLPVRLSLWGLAGIALGTARSAALVGDASLGLVAPTARTAMGAVLGTGLVLAAWPALQRRQARAGATSTTQTDAFRELLARSLGYRLFLVATAAVTEEVLYRGLAIGVGSQVLGSQPAAVGLSLVMFVVAHFRWGLAHMVSVLWAAVVLTALFLITGDLWACIAAHGAIDLMGLVIAPALLNRRGGQADI